MPTLDAIDRKLLELLQHSARTPLSTLATKVGRSRTAVQARIDRLEREGVIRGYHTILSGETGTRGVGTIMIVYLRERMKWSSVVDTLTGVPEIMGCYQVTGRADLIITISNTTKERLREVCEPIWALPEIRETDTLVVLKPFIESGD